MEFVHGVHGVRAPDTLKCSIVLQSSYIHSWHKFTAFNVSVGSGVEGHYAYPSSPSHKGLHKVQTSSDAGYTVSWEQDKVTTCSQTLLMHWPLLCKYTHPILFLTCTEQFPMTIKIKYFAIQYNILCCFSNSRDERNSDSSKFPGWKKFWQF